MTDRDPFRPTSERPGSSKKASPILVTGAHRTGTTWVGKMLAASGESAYISEPLNVWHRPGVLRVPVRRWYTYICTENEADFLPGLLETVRYRYHWLAELRSLRSKKDLLRMGRDGSTFLSGRIKGRRPLLKDPFSLFSAPWFAERLGCRVVITVRHPAAFASSLKRLGWNFNFADLLEQPLLMRDWLEPFRPAMEALLAFPQDVIGQSSLLWKMIYQAVEKMRQQNPDFLLVRHEDLSLDPVQGYRRLYHSLALNFSQQAERTILESSSAENPGEVSRRSVHSVRLDSRANLENWKRRLEADEIKRIRQLTEDVADRFYADIKWD